MNYPVLKTGMKVDSFRGQFPMDETHWEQVCEHLPLPPQQRRCLRLLLSGCDDTQVAKQMGLAVPTVRSHLKCVREKWRARDRSDLILRIFSFVMSIRTDQCDAAKPDDQAKS